MSTKENALEAIDASEVRAGQVWRHYKGGRYTVIAVGLDEATLTPVVIYAGGDGVVWTRKLLVFLQDVDGLNVPRFTIVDDEFLAATSPFQKMEPQCFGGEA